MRRAAPLFALTLLLALALWVAPRREHAQRQRETANRPVYVPVVPAPIVRRPSAPPTAEAAPSEALTPPASASGLDRLRDPALAVDRDWWDWPEAVFVCDPDGKRTIFRPEEHDPLAEDVYERKFADGSLRFYDQALGPRSDEAAWRDRREYTRPDGVLLVKDLPHCAKDGVRGSVQDAGASK